MEMPKGWERWGTIQGFPGYEVSSFGRIRCSKPRNRHASVPINPRLLKQQLDHRGYFRITLRKDKKPITKLVHRLVLDSFTPSKVKMETRHLNGNKTDNRIDNLKFGTAKQNADDRRKHGTIAMGSKSGPSKLSESSALFILNSDWSYMKLSKKFGITVSAICAIKKGRSWAHLQKFQEWK